MTKKIGYKKYIIGLLFAFLLANSNIPISSCFEQSDFNYLDLLKLNFEQDADLNSITKTNTTIEKYTIEKPRLDNYGLKLNFTNSTSTFGKAFSPINNGVVLFEFYILFEQSMGSQKYFSLSDTGTSAITFFQTGNGVNLKLTLSSATTNFDILTLPPLSATRLTKVCAIADLDRDLCDVYVDDEKKNDAPLSLASGVNKTLNKFYFKSTNNTNIIPTYLDNIRVSKITPSYNQVDFEVLKNNIEVFLNNSSNPEQLKVNLRNEYEKINKNTILTKTFVDKLFILYNQVANVNTDFLITQKDVGGIIIVDENDIRKTPTQGDIIKIKSYISGNDDGGNVIFGIYENNKFKEVYIIPYDGEKTYSILRRVQSKDEEVKVFVISSFSILIPCSSVISTKIQQDFPFENGSGSIQNPYVIATEEQFLNIKYKPNMILNYQII